MMGHRSACRWTRLGIAVVVAAVAAAGGPLRISRAQSAGDKPARAKSKSPAKKVILSADREQAALEFVKQHYPPLMEVLIYLKENNQRQYQRALADLDRSRQRLAQVQERSPQRYRLELEAWRLKSEIQLLSARLAMDDSPALRRELKRAVDRQLANRIALLELERKLAAQRLAKIESTLEQMQIGREQEAERLTKQLIARVQRLNKGRKKAAGGARRSDARTNEKPKKPDPGRGG